MALMDIGSAQASDMTNAIKDFVVPSMNEDRVQQQKETYYQNTKWAKQWGYFNQIADLKSALTLKVTWIVGKGYEADPETTVILNNIRGDGKQTFEDIIYSMEITKRIGGDAYAEIIRDPDTGELLNLKLLNTGTMKLVYGEKGNLKEYRQTTNIKGQNEVKFKPENIFHLSNNKISDQIHGISDIDAVEKYIQADAENFDDMKKIMHRGARPMILWKLKTDDTTKIAQFISRIDAARNLGEDMFIPDDEDIVTHEIVQVDVSANVLAWRDTLRNSFYRTIGLPQIVPGSGGQSTESESKVIYLAFEQIVEKDQRYLERQIKEQLGLNVNFLPPSTLSQDLQSDEAKDTGALSFQPNDSQVGGI